MSSSEEDNVVIPVKRIRRRKYLSSNENAFEQVNLFSRKVMPALSRVNKTISRQIEEEYKPQIISKPNADPLPNNQSPSSDDEVQFICEESPVKSLTVTPPPERNVFSVSKDRKLEKRKQLLLRNVASVLQKAKHESPTSPSLPSDKAAQDSEVIESNEFVIVKIRFQSSVYKYPLRKEIQFNEIFDGLAKDGNVNKENLLLTLNDRRIIPEDTPTTIGLTVVDFIDAVVMDEGILQRAKQDVTNKENFINVHFQSKFLKLKQTYSVNKFNPFSVVMEIYSSLIGYKPEELCFLFDGEDIDGSLSAIELDIDDDYCIDVAKTTKK